jgi:trans-aconitate methyltransferase
MNKLTYQPLEYIKVTRPVSRIDYVVDNCRSKRVLDLGCWDETALYKKETPFWLHDRIKKVAKSVIGIDSSPSLPNGGIHLGNSTILKGSVTDKQLISKFDIDVIVAGELIEHLPNTFEFFLLLKEVHPGKRFLCTTPNATSLSNIILGIFKRESTHQDHLSIYSYKTLNTICKKANVSSYELFPYYVKYSEMRTQSKGYKKLLVQFAEKSINIAETIFPLLSGGFIIDAIL